jgi:quercetin dioxygenase-like cupin family protein
MAPIDSPTTRPIVHPRNGGEALWFLGSLALVKSDTESTGGTVAVIEHISPPGSGSPLHRHTREDEWFFVIEGELTFAVGDDVIPAPAGSFVYGPRGIPHTFLVTSAAPARFLLVTEPAGFEGFMRALAVPAEELAPPPPPDGPPDMERVIAVAAEYGIEILGPPGIPSV